MRIEKINDDKIKVLLTSEDLKERDIKMTELAFGSDKTRELFKEVIDIASDECGFDAEGSQLMIEAIPVSLEAVVIMVTKMSEKEKMTLDKDKNDKKRKKRRPIFNKTNEEGMFIYEFHTLDDVSLVARTLYEIHK